MQRICRITVVIVSVAMMAPAVAAAGLPGYGSDSRCDGRMASLFERRVDHAQFFRHEVGLPDDRTHVLNVERDPSHQVPVPEWRLLMTSQEHAYYRARVTLAGWTPRVKAYAERIAGGDFVSVKVEDDFPSGPYIAVRVAKDVDRYASDISSLGLATRVLLAPFSKQYLEAVRDRITADQRALDAEGIWISSWGVSESENAVTVDLMSSRTDAIDFVEHRFGPGVSAELTATEPYTDVCSPAGGYNVGASGRKLLISWKAGWPFQFLRVKVRETTRSVRVGIFERVWNGPRPAIARFSDVSVKLKAPLGRRRVIDAETGRKLRRGRGRGYRLFSSNSYSRNSSERPPARS